MYPEIVVKGESAHVKKTAMSKYKDKQEGKELDLSLCNLTNVSVRDIALIPKATSLNLSYNKLICLPSNFPSLTQIIRLDLSNNSLTELPPDFGSLVNLQHLDLLNNQLKMLPISFGDLPKLKWLDVKGNPLEPALAEAAGDCLNEAECRRCASEMLIYMKQIQVEVRKKQQENARKQQVKAAAREALKKRKQKAEKMVEKERRRKEYESRLAAAAAKKTKSSKKANNATKTDPTKNVNNPTTVNTVHAENNFSKSLESNLKPKSQRSARKSTANNNNNVIINKKDASRTKTTRTWCGLFAMLGFVVVIIAVIIGLNFGADSKLFLQIQQKAQHLITAAKKMTKI